MITSAHGEIPNATLSYDVEISVEEAMRRSRVVRNKLKYMESIIALSEELNFTRAARKVRISQPTLTRNVAEAERLLGFCLFDRDHSNVQINDAGRAYVKQAKISVLHSERALQDARAAMQNADVVVNIGKSPYIDPFLVSTLLSIQLPLFPTLRINLSSHFSCDLVNDLLAVRTPEQK